MLQRALVCIAALAALLAVPAGAAAADVVRPSSIARTATLAPGTRTLSLECPSRSVALNAAVIRKSPGIEVRRSIPGAAAGDWRFRLAVGNDSGGRVRSVLRCVGLALPAGASPARIQVKTTRRPRVTIPFGGTTAVRARCGRAWLGTGYGIDAGASGDVRLAEVVPVAHGWDFLLENVGTAPVRARMSARCLRQKVRTARGSELDFRAARPARENRLGTGRTPTITHGCGRNRFSLATGWVLDPLDTIEVATSGPTRPARGRWTFRQATGGDRVRTTLVCLFRGSTFD